MIINLKGYDVCLISGPSALDKCEIDSFENAVLIFNNVPVTRYDFTRDYAEVEYYNPNIRVFENRSNNVVLIFT